MFVTKEFTFQSAHFLTQYHGKCERMHGHSYRLVVTVEGPVSENGLVIDFVILKRIVQKHVLELLDHHLLNDIIENPSAERVVVWIWEKLSPLGKLLREEVNDPNLSEEICTLVREEGDSSLEIPTGVRLHEVQLWETATSYVTYRG